MLPDLKAPFTSTLVMKETLVSAGPPILQPQEYDELVKFDGFKPYWTAAEAG